MPMDEWFTHLQEYHTPLIMAQWVKIIGAIFSNVGLLKNVATRSFHGGGNEALAQFAAEKGWSKAELTEEAIFVKHFMLAAICKTQSDFDDGVYHMVYDWDGNHTASNLRLDKELTSFVTGQKTARKCALCLPWPPACNCLPTPKIAHSRLVPDLLGAPAWPSPTGPPGGSKWPPG